MGNRGGISRERFFLYAFLGSFFWYFLPGYLFQALSVFSWVCWIAPDNIVSRCTLRYYYYFEGFAQRDCIYRKSTRCLGTLLVWACRLSPSTGPRLRILEVLLRHHVCIFLNASKGCSATKHNSQGELKLTSPLDSHSSSGS